MSDPHQHRLPHGVAVIGMSGRFPGAADLDQFWRNLRDGVEAISCFSDLELEREGISSKIIARPDYVKAAAVLGNIDQFDAAFFGFSPREAEILDPQHRLFLECAWHALEDAGYASASPKQCIGLYAGCALSTYLSHNIWGNRDVNDTVDGFQIMLGNDKDYLSTRVSYKLGLNGPSITVQTACSTSLVAVCLACQSLINSECDIALAGGVGIRIPEVAGYVFQEGSILSPDGHCRPFDSAARGTVRGNGLGIVVLKRLSDAIASRDTIRAVIKGWAINNDGSKKVGYTAPSIDGQAEVITRALEKAQVDPQSVSYVEAHGTGTQLGDPIEIAALTQAFRKQTAKKNFCAIGSVKSNLGHLDPAAGVAGLIKTILALEHRALPPSLHYHEPNPQLKFEDTPFYVNAKLSEWPRDAKPCRAGVSSFGIGGTNAHVVLEEAPGTTAKPKDYPYHLLVLSARSEAALERTAANLKDFLEQHPHLNMGDLAYTQQVGRKAFAHRRAIVCGDVTDAVGALSSTDPARVFNSVTKVREPKIAFLFPGQGAQHINMCEGLYRFEPIFAAHLDHCAHLLRPLLNLDITSVIYPPEGEKEEASRRLDQTFLCQPALFAIEYALANLWMSWGVKPDGMVGHSIGEYVAACLSGVLSLEAALNLVVARAQLMQQMPPGSMLVVFANEQEIRSLLRDRRISLAAVNTPVSCVISGKRDDLEQLSSQLDSRGIACRHLRTSHAFHSDMMDPIVVPFVEKVKRQTIGSPRIPYVSNVNGRWMTAETAKDPSYWGAHLRNSVRFDQGILRLFEEGYELLLEVGPGNQLSTLARQFETAGAPPVIVASSRDPRDATHDLYVLQKALAALWISGKCLDWESVNSTKGVRRIPLPGYPFEHQRFWIEPPSAAPKVQVTPELVPRRLSMEDWFHVPSWRPKLLTETVPHDFREFSQGWLLFGAEDQLLPQITARLDELGQAVVVAKPGASYFRIDDRNYVINPRDPRHYARLLEELRGRDQGFTRILHFWSLGDPAPSSSTYVEDLGFYSLLFLSQAIGNVAPSMPIRIGIIANGVHAISKSDRLSPMKATILGPATVIPQEYPHVGCKVIDIDSESSVLIAGLLRELDGYDGAHVAYRDTQRFVKSYEPVKLPSLNPPRRLRQNGVYLITGGLGGIGLVIARGLATELKAKLILTGRSVLPVKSAWDGWLSAHDPADRTSVSIRGLQELDLLGAEVLVANADVANPAEMQSVLDKALQRFSTVHGVIHAAGIAGSGLIQFKTREAAEHVLSSKVSGMNVLDALLKDLPLDFIAVFSSLASIVGGVGQVDYCAANAFLDAYSQHGPVNGSRHIVSINWPTWKEVGLSVNTPLPPGLEQKRNEWLRYGITSEEGFRAFLRILDSDSPQVLVSAFQVGPPKQDLEKDRPPTPSAPHSAPTSSLHPRPNLKNAFSPPADQLEIAIAGIWQEVLGIDRIGAQDNFFELGGHSLLAIKVLSRLNDVFHCRIPSGALFEAPTVTELAKVLENARLEMEDITGHLDLIEGLSEDEVRRLLSDDNGSPVPRSVANGNQD